MVTNLTKIVQFSNRTSAHAATIFINTWLARYPSPTSCIYDQGSEFIGWSFQHMLDQYDITRQPITLKNPQANAICKRMHEVVGNSLRGLKQWTPPNHLDDAHLLIDTALADAMYATRATFHSWLTVGEICWSVTVMVCIIVMGGVFNEPYCNGDHYCNGADCMSAKPTQGDRSPAITDVWMDGESIGFHSFYVWRPSSC
jgi:hypothetical protein